MFLKKIKCLAPFIVLLLSCSGKPPELTEIWWQLNVHEQEGAGRSGQSLSLFIHGEDEDGEDDLDRIYLINDDLEIYWTINSDQWVEYIDQTVTWIGSNSIKAPGDGTFPAGNYRVLLVDLGGERDEKSFYIRNLIPPEEERESPQLTFNSIEISVTSEYPLFQVWFYDEEGGLIEKSRSFAPGRYEWNEIARNITRRALFFSVYSEPESGAWGLVSGPYAFGS